MNVSNSQHCSNLQSENDFETHEEKMSVNSLGAVTLYALSYDHRDEADQYGVLYSGLNSCQVSGYTRCLNQEAVQKESIFREEGTFFRQV